MNARRGAGLVLGTRGSALALWQARRVAAMLEAGGYPCRIETTLTQGDRVLDVPLAEIGDKGLFTKELDLGLLERRYQLAVHSLKDLPTVLPPGVTIAAILERAEPWDALVAGPSFDGRGLDALPPGAVLATSSLRRQAQLKAWRRDLDIVPVRGNVDTRLRKLDDSGWHGMILAAAGLVRLGLGDRIRERIDPARMLPAVGQGALAVATATADEETTRLIREMLDHAPTAAATRAERAFLRRLEGGCQVPIGAWGRITPEAGLVLDGCIASLDGAWLFRDRISGDPAASEALGEALAEQLLGRGADRILADIRGTPPVQAPANSQ